MAYMEFDTLLDNNLIDFDELTVVAKVESVDNFWDDYPFLHEQEFMEMCPHSPSSTESSFEAYRPYACSYCSRAFTRRHDLQRHTRIHTGVKPYGCPCCQKSFSRSDARRRHFLSDPLCGKHTQVIQINQMRRRKH
ncbi:hypothetical protein INT47_001535 [Mucor saturninus]|uniref:C2H2-type domain-containing protein n=1 Tax=Mucor saturninus TaxID=64648 RepID=A0A8H7QSV9_9FUNG|nr:hypothetical protein INT47_001535 [Mucor saturninus]